MESNDTNIAAGCLTPLLSAVCKAKALWPHKGAELANRSVHHALDMRPILASSARVLDDITQAPDLPHDLLLVIVGQLSYRSWHAARAVNRAWRTACDQRSLAVHLSRGSGCEWLEACACLAKTSACVQSLAFSFPKARTMKESVSYAYALPQLKALTTLTRINCMDLPTQREQVQHIIQALQGLTSLRCLVLHVPKYAMVQAGGLQPVPLLTQLTHLSVPVASAKDVQLLMSMSKLEGLALQLTANAQDHGCSDALSGLSSLTALTSLFLHGDREYLGEHQHQPSWYDTPWPENSGHHCLCKPGLSMGSNKPAACASVYDRELKPGSSLAAAYLPSTVRVGTCWLAHMALRHASLPGLQELHIGAELARSAAWPMLQWSGTLASAASLIQEWHAAAAPAPSSTAAMADSACATTGGSAGTAYPAATPDVRMPASSAVASPVAHSAAVSASPGTISAAALPCTGTRPSTPFRLSLVRPSPEAQAIATAAAALAPNARCWSFLRRCCYLRKLCVYAWRPALSGLEGVVETGCLIASMALLGHVPDIQVHLLLSEPEQSLDIPRDVWKALSVLQPGQLQLNILCPSYWRLPPGFEEGKVTCLTLTHCQLDSLVLLEVLQFVRNLELLNCAVMPRLSFAVFGGLPHLQRLKLHDVLGIAVSEADVQQFALQVSLQHAQCLQQLIYEAAVLSLTPASIEVLCAVSSISKMYLGHKSGLPVLCREYTS